MPVACVGAGAASARMGSRTRCRVRAVPGEERPGRSLADDLPRTDLHRINQTAKQNGVTAC
jgi:hypothetical protein